MVGARETLAGAATIGERIQRLLTENGMSLSELHRKTGIAKGYLSELINAGLDEPKRKPSAETLYAVGTVLGVTVGDLLGHTLPSLDDPTQWPPGLQEYVRANDVTSQEARDLAGISLRGKSPNTAEDWKHIHRTIKMIIDEP